MELFEFVLICILLYILFNNINYHEYFHVSIQSQQQDDNNQLVDALLDDDINSNISVVPINNTVTGVVYNGTMDDLSIQHSELSEDAVLLISEDNSDNRGLLLGIIVIIGIGVCAAGKVFLNFKKPEFVNNDDLEGTELDIIDGTNPLAGDTDPLSELASILTLSDEERQARDLNPETYDGLSPRQRQQLILGLRP
jgi:hypothetical protein